MEEETIERLALKEGGRTAWVPRLQVCRRHVETATFLQRHNVSCLISVLSASPSVCMPLSFSHLSLSPTFTFYHRGNWPTRLLVVGGSGGGSCTSGVYYCIVWFYGCLIAPYCPLLPIGGQQKTLQRMFCASLKVWLLCRPSCLSHSLLMVSFVSRMHMADSPRLNRYDFSSVFGRDPCL